MGETPGLDGDVQDIANDAQSGSSGGDGGDGGDGGGMLSGVSLGLSRKHLLILGIIVVLGVALALRSSGADTSADGGESTDAAGEVEAVEEMELEDIEVKEDGEESGFFVPTDPDDELAKDEAVIEGLKDRGIIGGDDD